MSNFIKQHLAKLHRDRETVSSEITQAENTIKTNTDLLADIDKVIARLESMADLT